MADDKKGKKDEKPEEAKAGAEGAEGAPAEGAEGEEGGKKKSTVKKLILFVALPLVVVIGLGAGAYFMGFLDKFVGKKPNCEEVKEGDEHYAECQAIAEAEGANKQSSFLTIPDMIVNLNSNSKQPRFLKISIKVEFESDADQKKIEPLLPRVVDQFQTYLRELRMEDLRGTSGIYRMKIELLSRVRAAAPNVKVKDVLFQEILVQ